jgi:hypothetical protein
MTALGRHPNVLIGILLAAVVVLAFVALVGLGSPAARTDPTASAASASGPSSPPSPAPSSILPAAPEIPTTTEIAPGVFADCGHIRADACAKAIELARAGNEGDLVGTTLIVVDDICAPEVMCDRMFQFDSIVVFVTAGGDTTGWIAYHVVGLGDMPTQAERWQEEVPRHIEARIRAALATP